MSFDKSTYDVSEGDGGVDLTLQLSRPLPIGFEDSTFQLQLVDVNDHNASKLCRCVCVCVCVCTHVYELVTCVHVHQSICVCVCGCAKVQISKRLCYMCYVLQLWVTTCTLHILHSYITIKSPHNNIVRYETV